MMYTCIPYLCTDKICTQISCSHCELKERSDDKCLKYNKINITSVKTQFLMCEK